MCFSHKECDSQSYLKIINIMEKGSKDFGYNIIINEPVSGVNDAITYLLRNVGEGELKSAIEYIFTHYNCKITTLLTDSSMLGNDVYQVEIDLQGIPINVCKKLIGLKKVMKYVVTDNLYRANKNKK